MNELTTEPKTPEDILGPMMERLERIHQRVVAMRPEERAEMERQRKAQDAATRTAELRSSWNVPLRHLKCVPKLNGQWGKSMKMLAEMMDVQQGVTVGLIGGRGTGKTQLAVELMKLRTDAGKAAYFTSATEFFITIKATYDRESNLTEESVLRRFARYSLLVIDEIGKRGGSEWENNLLFEMLNRRYNAERDTILIDNRTRAEFITTIGPSLASRMSEGGGIIECNWESFRK